MTVRLPEGFDRTNAVVAAAVWLLAIVIYSLTKAPTVSFWDCGEFIAASVILGIPHPPGSPVFVMFGRIFSMIPFEADIATRVNFLSALCSSVAALFAYLVAVRILRHWFKDASSVVTKILIYGGAAAGTAFLAFGRTQWNNSVEAEVYGMSMLLFMLILWLVMIYLEHRGRPFADQVMLAIVYLAFFGIGVHMTTFLVFPVAAVALMLKKDTPKRVWMLVAAFFLAELYLIFALSSRLDEVPYYVPVIIVAVFYVFYALSFERLPRVMLSIGAGLLLGCLPVLSALGLKDNGVLTGIGIGALAGTSIYALIALFRAYKLRNESDEDGTRSATTIASSMVIVADIMAVLLVSNIRGYVTFLLLTVVLAAVVMVMIWQYIRWPILIAALGVAMVIVGIWQYVIGSLIAAVVVIILGRLFKMPSWRSAVLMVVMAAMGFSIHVFLPVRSSLHPNINENNPSRSLDTTINYLERKQYGSENMVERMFKRRAEWENQFGDYRRMGFWGFFEEQYGAEGPRFLVLFILGAFGLWETCRRRPDVGSLILTVLFITTVGLILYMNFADGTRRNQLGGDYLEVRDRDYFFTPGFMIYGLLIGMGISGLIQYIRDMVRNFSPTLRRLCVGASLVLLLLPAYAIAGNYKYCDRTNNYVPYDYAYNLLISADKDAVLFTNGDNDTFPLWCLQEAYKIRTDVRNVNLSLANTDWYVRQIRDDMGLKITWDDEQIDKLRPYRLQDGRTFRIQDQVIDQIVANNMDSVPIDFSITCGSSARKLQGKPVDSFLELHGLVYRLTKNGSGMRVNVDASLRLLMSDSGGYQFRHWNDPTVHMDETTARTAEGTADFFMYTINALQAQGRRDEAIAVAKHVIEEIPMGTGVIEWLATTYAQDGDTTDLRHLMVENVGIDSLGFLTYLARAYRTSGDTTQSEKMLLDILRKNPSYRPALDEIMSQYIAARDIQGMLNVMTDWVDANPNDKRIKDALSRLIQQLQGGSSPPGDSGGK